MFFVSIPVYYNLRPSCPCIDVHACPLLRCISPISIQHHREHIHDCARWWSSFSLSVCLSSKRKLAQINPFSLFFPSRPIFYHLPQLLYLHPKLSSPYLNKNTTTSTRPSKMHLAHRICVLCVFCMTAIPFILQNPSYTCRFFLGMFLASIVYRVTFIITYYVYIGPVIPEYLKR